MVIEEDFGNDYYGNLIIENYPNLQSIIVKNNSLKNLNSLKISNCEKLKIIETKFEAFYYINNVIIESISNNSTLVYISLIYNHSKQNGDHSLKQ